MNDPLPDIAAMPGVPPLGAGDVQLWFFPLGLADDDVARQLALLDPQERARADGFRFAHDRAAFARSHATLRRLLAAMRGCLPAAIDLLQPQGEKPVLRDGGGPHFSLSHSGDTGLVGLSDMPLGVDVETLRALTDRDAIARRFFAPGEVADLERLREAERHEAFFACWSRKEAYVKAIGLGLAAPLDMFRVSVAPDDPALLAIHDGSDDPAAWSLWSRRTGEAWAAAAVRMRDPRYRVFDIAT